MPVGTPFYMAPEQIQGQPVDARADIYSLGIVLYECLIGQRPFMAETPWAVLDMQLREPLPPPRALRPEIPEALERVIVKATAKQPEQRFESMEALVQALREVSQGIDLPAPETIVSPPLSPPLRRACLGAAASAASAWLWGGGAALALAAIAIIIWLAAGNQGNPAAPADIPQAPPLATGLSFPSTMAGPTAGAAPQSSGV